MVEADFKVGVSCEPLQGVDCLKLVEAVVH